ncbi:DUF4442 domain-containing protein [Piscinibacter koreensis]|uniref:DUF4442 domain-containing protein n=1 Tax=Piscinibacter koreensis TaxID=2742824 RepID=A0A7Y6NTF3_9BURK|nr:DUF4442 domain-containing protein [Schlegelella koreensis]NUZ08938.1 DUF4442 domain-containing protein [Schlegelella koreensis]
MNQTLARFHIEGAAKFTETILALTPFFKSLRPALRSLSSTGAEVVMPTPTEVGAKDPQHHTADDAALGGLALLTGGLALDAGAPPSARWALRGYAVQCAVQGRMHSEVHALADASTVDWKTAGDYEVEVQLLAVGRELVSTVRLMINVETSSPA